jgi:hypothetical protein
VILRLTSVASLGLGALALLSYLYIAGVGPLASPPARHLRSMKNRMTTPLVYEPFTLERLAALPRNVSYGRYIPLERRGVAVEGYVERLVHATDGDFHLDLRGPEGPNTPYAIVEITPGWRRGSSRWTFERLVDVLHPSRGGETPWDGGPRRVRVSGWLLYDFPHEGMRPRLGFPPAVAAWEVHPVTRLEIWDETLRRFVEYPR